MNDKYFSIKYNDDELTIYSNANPIHEETIILPNNNEPLKLFVGFSDTDSTKHIFDEIHFHNRSLFNSEIEKIFSQCLTLPSISGWDSMNSSKNMRFFTETNYNDNVQLKTNVGHWNTSKAYRANNTGKRQIEFVVEEFTNSSENIIFGLSDNLSSNYNHLGRNFPCAENSIGIIFYNDPKTENGNNYNVELLYALNRNYGSEKEYVSGLEINQNSVVDLLVDSENNTIKVYLDNELCIEFEFGIHIQGALFRPSVSLRLPNDTIKINTTGNFINEFNDYNPWGSINEIPSNPLDNFSFDWDQNYIDVVMRDNPNYYWRFQENSGLIAFDEVESFPLNHENGVLVARPGIEGFGVQYDSTQARTISTNFPQLNDWLEGSIELWIRYTGDLTVFSRILDLRTVDNDWSIRLNKDVDNQNNPIMTLSAFESSQSNVVYSYTITLEGFDFDQWNHIVITIDRLRLLEVFINGLSGGEICGVNWANKQKNYILTINSSVQSDTVYYFDELAFYDRVLSQTTIREHHKVGFDVQQTGSDLNLEFVGVPRYYTSTMETLYSTICEDKIKSWSFSSALGDWVENPSIELSNNIINIGSSSNSLTTVLENNTFKGYGDNLYNKLQVPSSIGNNNILIADCGISHTLILKTNGTVYSWGNNYWGQTSVPNIGSIVVQISTGDNHSVALLSNGSIVAWGDNTSGQCDIPATLTDAIQIAAGSNYTAVLRANGELLIFGDKYDLNGFDKTSIEENIFIQISALGGSDHIVALTNDKTVMCFGDNTFNQCDIPSINEDIEFISNGTYSSFAKDINGDTYTWGVIQRTNASTKNVEELWDDSCSPNNPVFDFFNTYEVEYVAGPSFSGLGIDETFLENNTTIIEDISNEKLYIDIDFGSFEPPYILFVFITIEYTDSTTLTANDLIFSSDLQPSNASYEISTELDGFLAFNNLTSDFEVVELNMIDKIVIEINYSEFTIIV